LRTRLKVSSYFFSIIIFLLVVFSLSFPASAFEEYTVTSEAKLGAKGAKEFHLTTPANLGGQINLQVWEEDDCLVKFECWAKANTQEKAKKFTDLVEMNLDREEEIITLKLDAPHPAPWEGSNYGIKVTLDIYVPHGLMLEAKTQGFDLDISGPLKTVNIQNHYGGIQVKDVSEETNIRGTYGNVDVENIRGELNIETSYNSVSATDINTQNGKAFLKTTYGKIDVERFRGQLEVNTVYSSIDGSDITLLGGRNEIKTVYSKINLEFANIKDAELYVKNTYGNIDMVVPKDLSARLMLTVGRGGKIHTSGILIKPLVLEKTRLEGVCGKEDSEIEMDIDGIGQILLEGR
jgi:hypothetical protein